MIGVDYLLPHYGEEKTEIILHKILPYFYWVVFISTVMGAFNGYLDHNPWTIGDWLVNYQGGMVRRGLLGDVIYQIARYTHINPGLYTAFLQSIFYAIFFFFSYLLLKAQPILSSFSLLIFSPFLFTFQINSLQDGGYRKEIIFFGILALNVWMARTKRFELFERIFFITLLVYPAIILTHEMLALCLPYLLVVYLSFGKLTEKKIITLFIILLPSVIVFIICVLLPFKASQVEDILISLARENYAL
ncbi:MAG: hypothetical protein FP816_15010 [Desulfobacteraceae bacterium]|nr:hypothetical protein [Desulfobacteraceae bacterium]